MFSVSGYPLNNSTNTVYSEWGSASVYSEWGNGSVYSEWGSASVTSYQPSPHKTNIVYTLSPKGTKLFWETMLPTITQTSGQ